MIMLPEKVEGKLFIMTLLICLGASVLSSQLILLTEQDRMVKDTKQQLILRSKQHNFDLIRSMNERAELGKLMAERLLADNDSAVNNPPEEAPKFQTSATGNRFGQWNASDTGYILSSSATLDDAMITRIEHASSVFDQLAPRFLARFLGFEIELNDGFYIASPISKVYERANGPQRTPQQMQLSDTESGRFSWGPIRYDSARSVWISTLTVPLLRQGKLVGRITADSIVEDLISNIRTYSAIGSESHALLINNKHEIVIHPLLMKKHERQERKGETIPSISMKDDRTTAAILQEMENTPEESGPSSFIEFAVGGIDYYAYIDPVGINDWKFVSYISTSHIETYLASLRWKSLTASIVLAFLLMLLIRDAFQRLFLNRIIGLEKATRDYAEHSEFVIPNPGKDEIGQLAYSFQELVQSLEDGKSKILKQTSELKKEITRRHEAQSSLEESEGKFKVLFDQSPDAIVLLDTDTWRDCNEAALKLLQTPERGQLIERRMDQLSPPTQPDGHDSKESWATHVKSAYETGLASFEWVILTSNRETVWIDVLLTLIPYEGGEVLYAVMRDIRERKREEVERVRLTTAIEQAAESILVTDTDGIILYVNPAFLEFNGYSRDAIIGSNASSLYGKSVDADTIKDMLGVAFQGKVWKGRSTHSKNDGTEYQAETTISPVKDASGSVMNLVYVFRDVSREAAMEAQLRQAQKMEAIGELASGIAHEINTPTQYVGDNIRFFRDSFSDISGLLKKVRGLLEPSLDESETSAKRDEIRAYIEEIDLEYLEEELPIAIEQSLEGNSRVAEIVRAMKEFAHPGIEELTAIDVNHAIQNTMSVARNEWKYVAEIETDLESDLPLTPCYPGSFNQVILNMFVNAAHAISDVVDGGNNGKGVIRVSTREDNGWIEVRISDTGCGIPEENRSKIFDPFFTTKEVGKGTGQGLSMAHNVIVEKHQGTIDVESTVGVGSTFIIRIPLETMGLDATG